MVALAVAFAHTEAAELERREPVLDGVLGTVGTTVNAVAGVAKTLVASLGLTLESPAVKTLLASLISFAVSLVDLVHRISDSVLVTFQKCVRNLVLGLLNGTVNLSAALFGTVLLEAEVSLLLNVEAVIKITLLLNAYLIPTLGVIGSAANC